MAAERTKILLGSSLIGGICILGGVKNAEMDASCAGLDTRFKSSSTARHVDFVDNANAFKADFMVSLDSFISCVFRESCRSEITSTIVMLKTVNVVSDFRVQEVTAEDPGKDYSMHENALLPSARTPFYRDRFGSCNIPMMPSPSPLDCQKVPIVFIEKAKHTSSAIIGAGSYHLREGVSRPMHSVA